MTNVSPATASELSAQERRRLFLRSGAAGNARRRLAGYALGWPWFDSVSVWVLRRLYFPASRLWAAAQIADGSPERFCDAMRMLRPADRDRLEAALARFDKARARAAALEAEWQRVFFGPEDNSTARRSAVEAARLDAAHAYNAARRFFGFLLGRVPPIRLETQSPERVAAVYGAACANFARLAAPPEPMPAVEVSRPVPGACGTDYWLRFRSPSPRLGDMVYARVHEPQGIVDPPTLILGHGICVEFDHWRGLIDEADTLTAAGFRVIRPEAPWHGRRTPVGNFGGERMITVFPTGMLDAFAGALQEWAVLADWARSTSRGPLAFGGTSLGALTAQLAADCARDGPARLRPDGLFLAEHCAKMAEVIRQGEMGAIFGAAPEAEAKGWTGEQLDACLAVLDPRAEPAVAPERIVSLVGRYDRVTPFASVAPLIAAWGLPEQNRFIWKRGHFSMPMTLIRDPRPVQRFCEVMRRAP
jgi:pimeloyl-ACP methyl ester carboxylesterase